MACTIRLNIRTAICGATNNNVSTRNGSPTSPVERPTSTPILFAAEAHRNHDGFLHVADVQKRTSFRTRIAQVVVSGATLKRSHPDCAFTCETIQYPTCIVIVRVLIIRHVHFCV